MSIRIEIVFDGDEPSAVLGAFLEGEWPRVISIAAYRNETPRVYKYKSHPGDSVTKTNYNFTYGFPNSSFNKPMNKGQFWETPVDDDPEEDDE